MYVVGLEEMVDLTATTVVLEAQSQKRTYLLFHNIFLLKHQKLSKNILSK